LNLLDKNGEYAALRFRVRIFEGKLVFNRLTDPAEHGFGEIPAIREDDPFLL
jgi:hypothetical protein